MRIHTTKDGKKIKLTDSHLAAMIRLMERKASEGITVCMGGGSCPDEFPIEGKAALEYDDYVKERDRHISNNGRQQQGKGDRDMSNHTEPAREPQVEIEVCKLDKHVTIVEELVNTLIQRLETIARPHCPNPDCNKVENRPLLVELADRLFSIDRRVDTIAGNLQNLLDRIEL